MAPSHGTDLGLPVISAIQASDSNLDLTPHGCSREKRKAQHWQKKARVGVEPAMMRAKQLETQRRVQEWELEQVRHLVLRGGRFRLRGGCRQGQ